MAREVGVSINAHQLSGWIPIRIYWSESRPMVDWCWVGKRRYTESFLDHTIDGCLRLPFANLCRPQTSIDLLSERHAIDPGVQPRGFIFHMSRCGSTLLSQMLAALPRNVVLSEAGSIDTVLRAKFREPSLTDEDRSSWLRWLVSALAQPRNGDEECLFIKFDSWSILDFPLIRRAFPNVPWIFLYRDPIEVLVSQLAHRGAHMVPGGIEPELFGMGSDEVFTMRPGEYCARVLATICEAALRYHQSSAGLMVNYAQLPEAAWTEVANFFGVEVSVTDLEAFKRVATRDAKNPGLAFELDSQSKRTKATDEVRLASAMWLAPLYERLQTARLGSQKS
jgi:gluconate kinase